MGARARTIPQVAWERRPAATQDRSPAADRIKTRFFAGPLALLLADHAARWQRRTVLAAVFACSRRLTCGLDVLQGTVLPAEQAPIRYSEPGVHRRLWAWRSGRAAVRLRRTVGEHPLASPLHAEASNCKCSHWQATRTVTCNGGLTPVLAWSYSTEALPYEGRRPLDYRAAT